MPDKIFQLVLVLFFFLFPLFFWSGTADAYEYNKMALLILACLALLFLFFLQLVQKRRLTLWKEGFAKPLFILSLAVCASTLLRSPNQIIALTTPLSVTTIVFGFLFYFLLVNRPRTDGLDDDQLFLIVVFSSVLICLYSLLLFTGILPASVFTPAGNLFATAMFLSVIGVYLLVKLVLIALKIQPSATPHQTDSSTLIFYLFSFSAVTITLIFLLFHLATDQKPVILEMRVGWIIFAETAKNLKTLLLGVGPANFITAFTLGKPLLFNSSPYWNIVFTSSSSFLLNLMTEAGIVAGGLFIYIFLKSIKLLIKSLNNPHLLPFVISLVLALFLQIIFPSSMVLFILTLILMALAQERKPGLDVDLSGLRQSVYLLLAVPAVFSGIILFVGARWFLAEYYFKKSLDAMLNNQAQTAYDRQIQAMTLNPSIDRYPLAFSKLNLALANALSAKENPTDADRQQIPQFVQQSINYGRNAVTLNRVNVTNWDNLAQTYVALLNFAQGAQEWAIASYQQKIQLDPFNPQNHISFGRLYFNLKKYDEAQNQFRQAVALKPDLPSAHYNLGLVLREQKKYQEAYDAFQTASALVTAGSSDAAILENGMKELLQLDPSLSASPATQTPPPPITP